jgi:hypothetical protein
MFARWPVILAVISGLSSHAAADALWSSGDYLRHYTQHYHGKRPLPHLRSAEQEMLFDHLVDSRNITAILATERPADEKLTELQKILSLIGAYRASYNLAVSYGEPLEQELTEVQAFGLEVAAAVAELSRQGDRIPCGAITTMIIGMIESVGEEQRYSGDQRAEIAEAISRNYPAIAPALTAGDRARLVTKAEALDVSVASNRQRAAIAEMWAVIASGP